LSFGSWRFKSSHPHLVQHPQQPEAATLAEVQANEHGGQAEEGGASRAVVEFQVRLAVSTFPFRAVRSIPRPSNRNSTARPAATIAA
jgi:hypothetical protein